MINKINFNNSKPSAFYMNDKRVRRIVLNNDVIYEYVPCTGINIVEDVIYIPDIGKKGDKYTVEYKLSPSDCTEKVTWSVDDNEYVSIDDKGVLTRLVDNISSRRALGVHARCESFKDSASLSVKYTKVLAEFDKDEVIVREGIETGILNYSFIQGNGDPSLITVTTTNEKPNTPTVVTSIKVTDNKVTFMGIVEGVGYLHLYYDGELMDTCKITSTPYEVPCTGLSLNISRQEIAIGQIFSLIGHITVKPSNCTDDVYASSSNNSIARASGTSVHGESAGTATITVYCGDYSASCTFVVE